MGYNISMRLRAIFFSRKIAALFAILPIAGAVFASWYYLIRVPPSPIATALWALTLEDYEGNAVKLSKFKKQPVIITAFGSWCPFCGPELTALAEAGQGGEVVLIAVNRAEPNSAAKDYIEHLPNKGSIIFLKDRNDLFYKAIGGYAMPETLFIAPRGEIFLHQRGPFDKPTQINARYVEFLESQEQK